MISLTSFLLRLLVYVSFVPTAIFSPTGSTLITLNINKECQISPLREFWVRQNKAMYLAWVSQEASNEVKTKKYNPFSVRTAVLPLNSGVHTGNMGVCFKTITDSWRGWGSGKLKCQRNPPKLLLCLSQFPLDSVLAWLL